MADVSPMIAYETGAGPKVNRTETMRPKEACAKEAAFREAKLDFDVVQDAATPRATSRTVLTAEPQR